MYAIPLRPIPVHGSCHEGLHRLDLLEPGPKRHQVLCKTRRLSVQPPETDSTARCANMHAGKAVRTVHSEALNELGSTYRLLWRPACSHLQTISAAAQQPLTPAQRNQGKCRAFTERSMAGKSGRRRSAQDVCYPLRTGSSCTRPCSISRSMDDHRSF